MKQQMSNVPGLLDDRPVVFDIVEVEQQYETAYSDLPEPDPSWRFVDAEGHGHFTADDTKNRYPTLVWTITRTYYCQDCRDEHDEGEYRCRLCGEAIQPGTRPPRGPVRIPTYRTFSATVSGPDVPQIDRDREYVVRIGRDTFTTRIGDMTLSSSGQSVVLAGGPRVNAATGGDTPKRSL